MSTPYQLLGGEAGIRRLADEFYEAMDRLPEAAAIRAMHAGDLAPIKQKLFEYLSGWLGGPHLYVARYGSFCLMGPHARYAIGPAERDQWLLCMREALRRVEAPPEVVQMLEKPLARFADALRTRDVAEDSPAEAGA
ncbi:MAG: group II truncated hemoglobin [Nevskia sp.]|nr:group II truncated hemoglobin [Nevskia sp.]